MRGASALPIGLLRPQKLDVPNRTLPHTRSGRRRRACSSRVTPTRGDRVTTKLRLRRTVGFAAVVVFIVLLVALPAFAGSSSTTLPNGAQLSVSINSPADGTQFLADGASVPVTVSGTASIGVGNPQATIVYVFD